jgi:hypothetical protein
MDLAAEGRIPESAPEWVPVQVTPKRRHRTT